MKTDEDEPTNNNSITNQENARSSCARWNVDGGRAFRASAMLLLLLMSELVMHFKRGSNMASTSGSTQKDGVWRRTLSTVLSLSLAQLREKMHSKTVTRTKIRMIYSSCSVLESYRQDIDLKNIQVLPI